MTVDPFDAPWSDTPEDISHLLGPLHGGELLPGGPEAHSQMKAEEMAYMADMRDRLLVVEAQHGQSENLTMARNIWAEAVMVVCEMNANNMEETRATLIEAKTRLEGAVSNAEPTSPAAVYAETAATPAE